MKTTILKQSLLLLSSATLLAACGGDGGDSPIDDGGANHFARFSLTNRFLAKRFNSPTDLVIHPNGDLYFTDPPSGLPHRINDPGRAMD